MAVISYELALASGKTHTFEVDPDRAEPMARPDAADGWTRLDSHRCANCPLNGATPHCPAALDIKAIADEFSGITSIERVEVTVRTEDRTYMKECDVQEALKSLFGLVLATSACPILSQLAPLARFHLPFATLDETALRVAGAFLIKQRARHQAGEPDPDWALQGLEDFYGELNTVNNGLFGRIRGASSEDANGNAMNIFCSITGLMQLGVDEMLANVTPLTNQLP